MKAEKIQNEIYQKMLTRKKLELLDKFYQTAREIFKNLVASFKNTN